MRAMVIDRCGGPDEIHLADLPTPQPGPGEVLIRVACAGVNPADWKTREGWLAPFFTYRFPFVLGFDLAGTVEAVGPGVSGPRVGERVVAYSKQGLGEGGAYAEYALAFAQAAVPLPDHVGFAEAATLPTAGVTAYEAVFEAGGLRGGQALLVHGGAGGVGSFAIQLGRHAGADVAATCSEANFDYVRGLGAGRAIGYGDGSVLDAVREWSPDGVDLVVDAVGQGTLPQAVEIAKTGGRVAAIATLVAGEPQHDAAAAARRGVRIVPTMSSYERAAAQLRALVGLLGQRRLRAPAIELVPLAQAAEAHRRIQAGHVRGKLVLQVGAEA
jgi:NADPH:quinone reductase-like Zn-dependent oxidoreductase